MTIKQFIEKAIEGGWKYLNKYQPYKNNQDAWAVTVDTSNSSASEILLDSIFSEILLDPKAWIACGKVEGWEDWSYSYYVISHHTENDEKEMKETGSCDNCGYWQRVDTFDEIPERLKNVDGAWRTHPQDEPEYLNNMHRMIDALAEGKTIEEYIKTL